MADAVTIKVVGLSELRGALKQFDKNTNATLTAALGKIAGAIAAKVAGAMPHSSGFAAGTVQPHIKVRAASISIGTGAIDDYVPWLDFGGHVGRRNSISRPFIKTGRYLYPQIIAARPQTLQAIDQALGLAASQAGFVTKGEIG